MCRAMRDRVQRLQAVHDKFRAVVDEGERMPSTWSEAKPQHRQAFENFFAGWKPLPPSMSQPQRKLQTRAPADGTTRGGSRRGPAVKVEDAPVVRSPGCVAARVRAGTLCLSDVEFQQYGGCGADTGDNLYALALHCTAQGAACAGEGCGRSGGGAEENSCRTGCTSGRDTAACTGLSTSHGQCTTDKCSSADASTVGGAGGRASMHGHDGHC